jgi:hypothetical protein
MPCSMHDGVMAASFANEIERDVMKKAQEAMAAADEVTAILCKVLRSISPEEFSKMDADVHRWFDKHLEHDAKHGRPA